MTPDFVEQFFLGNEPVATREQIGEHVKHLRFHVPALALAAQLVEAHVELEVAEPIDGAVGRCHTLVVLVATPASGARELTLLLGRRECKRITMRRECDSSGYRARTNIQTAHRETGNAEI